MKTLFLFITIYYLGVIADAQTLPKSETNSTPKQSVELKHFDPAHRAERMTKLVSQKLNLNAEQATQFKALSLNTFTEIKTIRCSNQTDPKNIRPEIKKTWEQFGVEVKKILTPEQASQAEEIKNKFITHKHHHKVHHKHSFNCCGNNACAVHAKYNHKNCWICAKECMKGKLNLTENQIVNINKIQQEFRTKAKNVRQENTDCNAKQEAMQVIRNEKLLQIYQILTPEQQAIWKESNSHLKDLTNTSNPNTSNPNPNIYPNPTSGNTSIDIELTEVSDVEISVLDRQGAVRNHATYLKQGPGKVQLPMDTQPLGVDVYSVQIQTKGESGIRHSFLRKVSVTK